ncbi:MAG: tRNA pseudouridine(38-40) synthase TruA [Chloroflexota bacterium]
MPLFRATLAYDGTAYQGFQRQPADIPTIQLAVERAIARITQDPAVTVLVAGRTDSGVHARGQVIAFEVAWRHSVEELLRAINAVLPDDIALQDLRIQPGFHPRYDAHARAYSYTVIVTPQRQPMLWRASWQIHVTIDFHLMISAAALLIGKHDFGAFGNPPQGENTVREIFSSGWASHAESYGQRLVYTVEGTAFLHHMVRRMVGMQVDVGRGLLSLEEFERVFRSADLSQAGTMAPSQGLVLEKVRYPGED